MRILLIEQIEDKLFYPSIFFRKFGHDVYEFDITEYYSSFLCKGLKKIHSQSWQSWISHQLFIKVKQIRPDVILFYNLEYLDNSTINEVKNLFPNVKLVCWHGDDLLNPRFQNFNQELKIPLIDIHVTPRFHLANEYLNLGAKEVLKVSWHYKEMKTLQSSKYYDLNFIGSVDAKRKFYIEKVVNNSFIIGGYGWKKVDLNSLKTLSHLSLKQMNVIISASKLSLNFLTEANRDKTNFRNFEIPSQLSLQITERSEEICDIFGENIGVVCFETPEEMNDKINYYLMHENERNKILIKSHKIVNDYKYSIDCQLSVILNRLMQ
jgi:hypothetical protein